MKQRKKEVITQELEVVEKVACNCCGAIFNSVDWLNKTHEITINLAPSLNDENGKSFEFDLCEYCVLTFVKTFVHEPTPIFPSVNLFSEHKNVATENLDNLNPIDGYTLHEIDKAASDKEKTRWLSVLNSFPVITVNTTDVILIVQTNEFCFYLEQLKPVDWEHYVIEHSDGEYVNVAPLAFELNASWDDTSKQFLPIEKN